MKVRLEIDDSILEDEVVIRCKQLSDEIIELQRRINESSPGGVRLEVTRDNTLYYLGMKELIFFETAGSYVAVHTKNEMYETKQKLYELEDMLPRNFVRVSKSTIINVALVRAVHKNITGASEVEFIGSNKRAYVSRNYYKAMNDKMEEMRFKR